MIVTRSRLHAVAACTVLAAGTALWAMPLAAANPYGNVTICHATGTPDNNGNSHWVEVTSDAASDVLNGHDGHDADVIPPFSNGTYVFAGQNWHDNWAVGADGVALERVTVEMCSVPAPDESTGNPYPSTSNPYPSTTSVPGTTTPGGGTTTPGTGSTTPGTGTTTPGEGTTTPGGETSEPSQGGDESTTPGDGTSSTPGTSSEGTDTEPGQGSDSASTPAGSGGESTPTSNGDDGLAYTGTAAGMVLALAGALGAAGTALLVARRRMAGSQH